VFLTQDRAVCPGFGLPASSVECVIAYADRIGVLPRRRGAALGLSLAVPIAAARFRCHASLRFALRFHSFATLSAPRHASPLLF